MAIKPANSNYHTFTFNGVRAADYGIYVTDVNVFNSAARDVEYIQIPGRDGAFALDRGRFQNISVVYKCAMTQDTDEDFATAISEFRNAIASTKGYKRLEDDIHTDEYRMGVFSKGLEAPTLNTKTATFDVEFNCQPQRFLKSGETAVSVASGGTLTNPTLFESHPLLQVWGYGNIGINDDTISIADDVIGDIVLSDAKNFFRNNANTYSWRTQLNGRKLRDGDAVKLINCTAGFYRPSGDGIASAVITRVSGEEFEVLDINPSIRRFSILFPELSFTAYHYNSYSSKWNCKLTLVTGATQTYRVETRVSYQNNALTIEQTVTPPTQGEVVDVIASFNQVTAYSTKSALGEPLYFDLDIGEAYKEEDGTIISVNNAVSFPAQLPALKSGASTITYENTVDRFKIVPRWWEV